MNDYQPIARGAEAANVAVDLRIEDRRHEVDIGDGGFIGVIVGPFGERVEYRLTDPAAVRHLTRAATKDALRLARTWVSQQAPRTLVVVIRKFWVAVPSREARVVVEMTLQDAAGTALWSGAVAGGAGGVIVPAAAEPMMRGIYQRALTDYAETAAAVFASPEFQRQLY